MPRRSDAARVSEVRALLRSPFFPGSGIDGVRLTARQAEVARIVALGATAEKAAAELGIPKNTVVSHLRDVKKRTGMGRFELTRWVFDQLEAALR